METQNRLMFLLHELANGHWKSEDELHFAKHQLDWMQRDLACSPFAGNYNEHAGWVICIKGSPPRAILLIYENGHQAQLTYLFHSVHVKKTKFKREHKKIFRAFYDEHLKDKKAIFKLPAIVLTSGE